MPTSATTIKSTVVQSQIQCSSCNHKLPLRLTNPGENAALWKCSECQTPLVAYGIEEMLPKSAKSIRLDEHYFDVGKLPEIDINQRQEVANLAHRVVCTEFLQMRRSKRKAQCLVVPAIALEDGFVPENEPFKIMVANLSREGIGLVHTETFEAAYIAIELSPQSANPIQVIVKLVRQVPIEGSPYFEIGGEFYARLGSLAIH